MSRTVFMLLSALAVLVWASLVPSAALADKAAVVLSCLFLTFGASFLLSLTKIKAAGHFVVESILGALLTIGFGRLHELGEDLIYASAVWVVALVITRAIINSKTRDFYILRKNRLTPA